MLRSAKFAPLTGLDTPAEHQHIRSESPMPAVYSSFLSVCALVFWPPRYLWARLEVLGQWRPSAAIWIRTNPSSMCCPIGHCPRLIVWIASAAGGLPRPVRRANRIGRRRRNLRLSEQGAGLRSADRSPRPSPPRPCCARSMPVRRTAHCDEVQLVPVSVSGNPQTWKSPPIKMLLP